jgi:hypothetical protein
VCMSAVDVCVCVSDFLVTKVRNCCLLVRTPGEEGEHLWW